MKRVWTWPVVVVAVFLSAGTTMAQETTGAIIGTITSEDGQPLPGVTVTIEDPERGLLRSTSCFQQGTYKFAALYPARYELTATLPGFQSVKLPVRVELGRTVTSDIEMKLGQVTETIEVTADVPQVDVTSTVGGMTVRSDLFLAQLPVARESTQIAFMLPGTTSGDRRFDVGDRSYDRSNTPGQELVSIGGSSVSENLYLFNGLDITSVSKLMGSTFVPMEFVEEVQIKTGGYEAEFGRSTGGVINMVSKSGTNTVHGGGSAYWEPEGLQDAEPDSWDRHNSEGSHSAIEGNASIGGPFVKDRLFYFAFLRYVDSTDATNRGTRDTVRSNNGIYYGAKVDWNLTSAQRLEGTYLVDETDYERALYAYDPEERARGDYIGTGIEPRGGANSILKYSGIFGDNVLLSAQAGHNQFDRSERSNRDEYPVAYDCRVSCTPIGLWVNWGKYVKADDRQAYRVDIDWFVGDHSMRGGIDYQDNELSFDGVLPGDGFQHVYYLNGVEGGDPARFVFPELPWDTEVVREVFSSTQGDYQSLSAAAYAQDSWSLLPSLTLNIGVRWEMYENKNAVGTTFIKITDQFAPRIGVIWDPGGRGSSKVTASWGVYHMPIPGETNYYLGGRVFNYETWYELVGGINPDGSPMGFGLEGPTIVRANGEILDPNSIVDTDLDPMSQNELILGYESMVGKNWSVGARFLWREFNDVIEDISIDEALLDMTGLWYPWEYRLTNPGTDFTGFVDLDGDGELDPIALTADQLGYPPVDRQYYAVELSATRRFARGWMLQGSYTWSQSYGNYEGFVKSDIGQDDFGLTQDFDYRHLMDNVYGFLPNDRRHSVKVFGNYSWDWGLQLGGFVYYSTGRPRNAISVHPTDFFASLYGSSSFFYVDGTPAPRGSVGATDDIWGMDGMVKYDFVARGLNWNVRLDVFNLLGEEGVVYYGEYSSNDAGAPEPSFGQPIYYQEPRRVRLGFGVSF